MFDMLHVSPLTKGSFIDWPQDLTCAAQFCGTPLKETYLVKFLKFLLLLLRACFDLFLHQLFALQENLFYATPSAETVQTFDNVMVITGIRQLHE